ncbi:ABC transporter substrate-binding protein [Micromonospora halophytica]|uniref:Monosaccharide ABC transporter substrate-binding protein, CUT2 family n=1 Tax=Micromonospora halophytica TaxID=47864 RepID=A0A1C5IBA7_9ACTN|nr:ABC transporter substrate-binding protein [Micromonospora halophytica]SCG55036.1 monosaccharide ABC transporter substrate-binding protein, CUT2 family [Micromonospora halophytica]
MVHIRTTITRRGLGALLAAGLLATGLSGCGNSDTGGDAGGTDKIVLGFSQVGAESGWRTANTNSIKEAAGAAGIELKFDDAQQKQENQIKAIRNFIQQKVDVIAFSPVVESGWDTVLKEARDAKIPVILTDRSVDSADKTLYQTFIGSDFVKEGRLSGEWLVEQTRSATGPVNIVELQGTTGSAPANDRRKGFAEAIAANPNLKVVASQSGDFTRAGGKQVMEQFLKANPKIDVLFAHNDDMGLGALEAITAAGKVPGKDITIITIDAVKDGMQALADGKFNFIAECSPLLGPQLMDLVKKVHAGESVPTRVETEETTFTVEQAKAALPTRKY